MRRPKPFCYGRFKSTRRSAELLSNLGVVQSDMGQFEKARASYEKAIALRPNSPVAINNLGNAFLKLNLLDRAIQTFDRALALKPDYVDAIYNRGNALLSARRLDEALQVFERVIRMQPLYALAYNGTRPRQCRAEAFR